MGWFRLLVRKGYTFWRLEWGDRWLLLQALVLLPLVALSLKIWGVRRTQSTLARLVPAPVIPSQGADQLAFVWNTARIVRVAARYNVFWSNCLKQSLVLWWLLRRQRIGSDLRIGVRREQGLFEAHAWVEYHEVVLNDSRDVRRRFAMFSRPIQVKL